MVWNKTFLVNNKQVKQYINYNCMIHLLTLEDGKVYIKYSFSPINSLGVHLIGIKLNNKNVKNAINFYNVYALIRHILDKKILVNNIQVIKHFNNFVYKKSLELEASNEYMAETL